MYRRLLNTHLKKGAINLQFKHGEARGYGSGEPVATWLVDSEATMRRITRNWAFQLGETYTQGHWDVADGRLADLLYILRSNFSSYRTPRSLRLLGTLVQQWNRISNSFRNVSHHYDLDQALFRLFLDRDMHYSCAYFEYEGMSLEDAQQAKCRHIAEKLLLESGQRVLDIGCGWGSLAMYLARNADVEVTGITLSQEQLTYARRRAQEEKLDNVRFELMDYREQPGSFDRVVSVGMFEHVGRPYYRQFYRKLGDLLPEDGVALIHSIGTIGRPGPTNPWIRRYIFPGGALPSLSQMSAAAEGATLIQTDVEVLRLHYALTLRAWQERFQASRDRVRQSMGEKFCRMWEFYLAASEASFRCRDLVVFQQQIATSHGAVPITRDYLHGPDISPTAIPGSNAA